MTKVSAIIVAAGAGKRFGSAKQFALLRGKSVLDWSLEAFAVHPEVDEIVLVLPAEEGGKPGTGSAAARSSPSSAEERKGRIRSSEGSTGWIPVRPISSWCMMESGPWSARMSLPG